MWRSRMAVSVWFLLASVVGGCANRGDSGAMVDAGDGGAMVDASPAALCAACAPDQICIQSMHSNIEDTCQSVGVWCEARDPRCVGTACSPDCNFWQCGDGVDAGVLSCRDPAPPCANAVAGALQCWGP